MGKWRYAHWTGTTWITQTIFNDRDKSLSLMLDVSNNPRLAFGSYGDLKYATTSGGVWVSQTIEINAEHPSLALDGTGVPAISTIHGGAEEKTLALSMRFCLALLG